jgi:hypothetical protein
LVHGDSHYTHECEVAQNSTDGHGQMYAVHEAGHQIKSSHRMQGETGDLGMDPPTDSSGTKDGPETYTQRMVPSSLFQTVAPTNTSGDLAVLGECGLLCGESLQDLIGTGLHRLHWIALTERVGSGGRYIRTKI